MKVWFLIAILVAGTNCYLICDGPRGECRQVCVPSGT